MSVFSQLKQQLNEQLLQLQPIQGWIQLQASVSLADENLSLLNWLKTQASYFPHFFLEKRDQVQTIATAGQALLFSSLEEAQAFISQTNLTLVGGIQFEGQCKFVLPRLMLVKDQKKLTAYLTLNGEEQAVDLENLFADRKDAKTDLAENTLLSTQTICSFEQWENNITQAIEQIKKGAMRKVVLANATQLCVEKAISAYDLLAQSQEINLGCYHFLWAEKEDYIFVGSTPERLYHRQGNLLFTEALAGTVAVAEDETQTEKNAAWLLQDAKNIYENQLVVEDIEAHLKEYVSEFEVSSPEIKRLHNVQHLRRCIKAVLKPEVLDNDCLRQIHPTAAVAGLPRMVAKQFIATHEPFTRNWYAGTLGMLNQEEAEFCVMLRSALIQENQITLYAGAGIVEDSEPVSEWHEIERKSQALAKLLPA